MNYFKTLATTLVLASSLAAGSVQAATFSWGFDSGGTKTASASDGGFTSTMTANGDQLFNYPGSNYLRSSSGTSGDTLTLTFSQAIDTLSFDIGSLDGGNGETVVFDRAPIVSAPGDVQWGVDSVAVLNGTTLSSSSIVQGSANVTFTGLGGITSFTFAEVFLRHAIYYDNFTATTDVAPVPLPAGLPLLLAALGTLGLTWRRKAS